jgi:hypothetical protein
VYKIRRNQERHYNLILQKYENYYCDVICISGTLPTVLNNTVTLTVCQRGFIECCEFTWNMAVRNCGSFNVFRLTPTPTCPGRYCIGNI